MTNTVSPANRPRLCRSDHQPNMLEYIDTALNESFSSRLKLTTNSTNNCDQYGNTIIDQQLLYLLCQKFSPNRIDTRTQHLYQSLHELLLSNEKISKAFFEYSPPPIGRSTYQSIFISYANFIWNEIDVDTLLELGCFLLKYRLCDIFTTTITMSNNKMSSGSSTNSNNNNSIRQKITGYFTEIITLYYLSTYHQDFFAASRATDMFFPPPKPSLVSKTSLCSQDSQQQPCEIGDENVKSIFSRFLRALHDNGEVCLDMRQVKLILQSDAHQYLNKKLENKKLPFSNFFETTINKTRYVDRCRSLKSSCRFVIKMHLKHFPSDIKYLSIIPRVNEQLRTFLTYENKYAFESNV